MLLADERASVFAAHEAGGVGSLARFIVDRPVAPLFLGVHCLLVEVAAEVVAAAALAHGVSQEALLFPRAHRLVDRLLASGVHLVPLSRARLSLREFGRFLLSDGGRGLQFRTRLSDLCANIVLI